MVTYKPQATLIPFARISLLIVKVPQHGKEQALGQGSKVLLKEPQPSVTRV